MGFDRTERESPFVEGGSLWSNSYELVCDETAYVIRSGEDFIPKENDVQEEADEDSEKQVAELSSDEPRYRNSKKVILPGGNQYAYEWGSDDGEFVYDKGERHSQ